MQPPTQPDPAPAAPAPAPAAPALPSPSWAKQLAACAALALLSLLAYANTFHVPFYFDDRQGITQNESIDQLWPLWRPLVPPVYLNSGAVGRPLVNFSLAVNYQIAQATSATHDGMEPTSYHVVNLIFHIIAACLLMGVLWRTLRQPVLAARFGAAAFPLAFVIALVWAVHPLMSETVTNAIQRNESMVSIFYLLVIYCFIRSVEKPRSYGWQAGAVAACFLGVATKELMFSAPLMALLYDRTFVAGSFRDALARRWKFYGAMATSWGLLGFLVHYAKQRGGTVGFGLGMSGWAYALKQCQAIIEYFRLAFWPHPLVLDYGCDVPGQSELWQKAADSHKFNDLLTAVLSGLGEVWPQAVLLLILLAAAGWALWRKPVLGFAAAWVFIILAPSSSFLPLTTQTEAEHRMYMPLIAIVAVLLIGAYRWLGRWLYYLACPLVILFAATTYARNRDYRTELSMWLVNVNQRPNNDRAHYDLGCALLDARRYIDAAAEFSQTIQLSPKYVEAHTNLGASYADLGDLPRAKAEYEAAVAIKWDDVQSNYNLGSVYWQYNDYEHAATYLKIASENDATYTDALFSYGAVLVLGNHSDDALKPLLAALALDPHDLRTLMYFGTALQNQGRLKNAIAIFQKGLALDPKSVELHEKLAGAYSDNGQKDLAIAESAEAVRLAPKDSTALYQYGQSLVESGRDADAVAVFNEAIKYNSEYADAHDELGHALLRLHRNDEAKAAFNRALELKPGFADAQLGLGQVLLAGNQLVQAEMQMRAAIKSDPDYAVAHNQLGQLLQAEKRTGEAIYEFTEALRLDPGYAEATANLKATQAGQ